MTYYKTHEEENAWKKGVVRGMYFLRFSDNPRTIEESPT
jgi:hypothetical protein